MNRARFMEQLSRMLSDLPEGERREALDYYNSYFDDAGPENEDAVIRELGSPGKVAAIIKADLQENAGDYGEYTESGYEDTRTREPGQMPETYHGESREGRSSSQGRRRYQERGYRQPSRNRSRGILLLILLVFVSPLLVGTLGGLAGGILALIFLPFIVVFAFGAASIALLIAGGGLAVTGIVTCTTSPVAGIVIIGAGCFVLAVGLLLLLADVWLGGRMLPWIIRKVTDTVHNLFQRRARGGVEE